MATTNSGTVTLQYDGESRRVLKRFNSGEKTVYVYDTLGRLAAEYGGPPAFSGTRFMTQDPLGSTRVVTDETMTVRGRHDFLPFGEEIPSNVGLRPQIGAYGGLDAVRHRFTGKERDFETGLDYFGARYFSGGQGRFTGADAVLVFDEHTVDPQQWNRYSYVRNNPLRYIDPNGQSLLDVAGGIITAFGSNLILGANRPEPYNPDFAIGQAVGDAASVVAGGFEFTLGAGTATGGTLATATGVLAPAGVPAVAVGMGEAAHGLGVSASGLIHLSSAIRNPFGSKGKPDHQEKVEELNEKAQAEAQPGETVRREQQIQGYDSRRKPDVQIVDPQGKTRKVFEAERHPTWKRNRLREQEYRCLGVECETHDLKQ